MYEFGEELIIESYKVPWLIWIQLLVMILLLLLLFYGFTLSSFDVPTVAAAASSTSIQSHVSNSRLANINASLCNTMGEEIQNTEGNAGASTSREISAEQIEEHEGSSAKDSISLRPFSEHPCHFLGLAKQAFLKCLGLDFSKRAPDSGHMKDD